MFETVRTAILTLGACAVCAPALAHGDVIQATPNGFSWVAGGPPAAQVQPIAQPAPLTAEPAYTEAVANAGPDAWRAHVAALAAKYDISPALLEAVVWQESRWRASALSPKGAYGLTQLMPGTARDMGVDRTDPHANLDGGARYLRMQLDAFGGDVEKALAAYNAGARRVIKAGGVPQIPETQAYVAAIMARLSGRVRR